MLTHDEDAVEALATKIMVKEMTYLSFREAISLINAAIAQVEAQHPDWKERSDLMTRLTAAASAALPSGMIMQDTPAP